MVRLLTQRDAATLLRLSERTLERLRVSGGGPHFVKTGRLVRYREADLEAWIAARIVGSTSVPVAALQRKLEETGRH
jgi:excisionase family DNA binding protein